MKNGEENLKDGKLKSPLYTVPEAAEYLRIKPNTLSIWISKGRGPMPTRLGRRVLFGRDQLDRFIEQNTVHG